MTALTIFVLALIITSVILAIIGSEAGTKDSQCTGRQESKDACCFHKCERKVAYNGSAKVEQLGHAGTLSLSLRRSSSNHFRTYPSECWGFGCRPDTPQWNQPTEITGLSFSVHAAVMLSGNDLCIGCEDQLR